jgi:hypothetical protein
MWLCPDERRVHETNFGESFYFGETESHHLRRFEVCFDPRWSKISIAELAVLDHSISCDTLGYVV